MTSCCVCFAHFSDLSSNHIWRVDDGAFHGLEKLRKLWVPPQQTLLSTLSSSSHKNLCRESVMSQICAKNALIMWVLLTSVNFQWFVGESDQGFGRTRFQRPLRPEAVSTSCFHLSLHILFSCRWASELYRNALRRFMPRKKCIFYPRQLEFLAS